MATALLSDLHLGCAPGCDLVRDAEIQARLLRALEPADTVVLLGDAFELRDRPMGEVVALAGPFIEELGAALGDARLVIVPGNHDHRLAEPLLDRRSLGRPRELGLQQRFKPTAGPAAAIARRLGRARVELAYPGLWIRDDVYATHGHYLDCHLTVPRVECLVVAASERLLGGLPQDPNPEDYERILAPVYSFSYGFAQAGGPARIGAGSAPSLRVWWRVNGGGGGRSRVLGSVIFPAAVRVASRGLRRPFEADVSAAAIARGGLAAMREVVRRLGIEAEHVIYGHTHHPGPRAGDAGQADPRPSLHNCGSWTYTPGLCGRSASESLFWPGSVIWVGDEGPPERREVLAELGESELREAARRNRRAERAPA
jgi:Calcineurin-like phosphoesterase